MGDKLERATRNYYLKFSETMRTNSRLGDEKVHWHFVRFIHSSGQFTFMKLSIIISVKKKAKTDFAAEDYRQRIRMTKDCSDLKCTRLIYFPADRTAKANNSNSLLKK